ncbi:unnamed protein product [Adineta steineri]|uniref:Uncharacterized protein n=1 Tax=Adineta steineri TaxID=433720 RepID=A0A819CRP5_9BILA|nr:unnamed protein product [Adineta steineri]
MSTIIPSDKITVNGKGKWRRRHSIVREFSLNTSTHGIPGIARSESIHNRVFWSISFIGFAAIMVYFIVKAISAYFGYPTQFNLDVVSEWPQYFPAVTICNSSPLRFDKFIEPFLNYTNSLNLTNSNDTSTLSSLQATYISDFLIDKINKNVSLESMFYSLSSMLYKCTYNGLPCSTADFISFTTASYGRCYTFNAKMINSNGDNLRYGNDNAGNGILELEFYIHSHQYVPYFTTGMYWYGISVVHDNTEIPRVDAEGIELTPGRKHKLAYKKKQTFLLPSPYTECTDKVSFDMQTMLTHYDGADYGNVEFICFQVCGQVYAKCFCCSYEQCGCIDPTLWNTQSLVLPSTNKSIFAPLCKSSDTCYTQSFNTLLNSYDIQDIYCADCSQQCTVIDFFIQTSSLAVAFEWEMNGIKAFVENSSVPLPSDWSTTWRTYIPENYLVLRVVRDTNLIENYTQTAQLSVVDVLSNIGGQTGLWIGISFLSLMEFIEMLYRLVRYQCHLIQVAIQRRQ